MVAQVLLICVQILYAAELQKFQGQWQIVSMSFDGEVIKRELNGGLIRVKGNKILSIRPGTAGEKEDEPFWIDAFKNPRQVCITWYLGIYEFNKDELRVCVQYAGQGVEGENARNWRMPEDFVPRKDEPHFIMVLRRVPEAKP